MVLFVSRARRGRRRRREVDSRWRNPALDCLAVGWDARTDTRDATTAAGATSATSAAAGSSQNHLDGQFGHLPVCLFVC